MKKKAYQHQNIQQAIDATLSGVTMPPEMQNRILRQARGEQKVKKKLSAGLVLAIVLIVATVAAIAATLLWENYAGEVIRKEQEIGTYAGWGAADKEALIKALVEMGYIENSMETKKLFAGDTAEAEKHALADRVILVFIKENENVQTYAESSELDAISAGLITTAVMGSSDSWPAEKRVWWQRLINPNALEDPNDIFFVNPEPGDITEKEAIAIAKKAVIKVRHVPESEINAAQAVADLYVTEERPEYRRWFITFNLFAEGSKTYVERWYEVFMDSKGNLIADADYGTELLEARTASLETNDRNKVYPPILSRYQEYAEYEGSYEEGDKYLVREWSLESKAEYSQELRPQVLALLESGDLAELTDMDARYPVPHQEIVASTMYAYGLPREDDIPLDDARNLARLFVWNRYGLEEQENTDHYCYYEYYDVTNPDLPVWKFVFFPESFAGMSEVPVYRVVLNAYTGENIAVERYGWKEIFEGEPFNSVWY